MKKLIAVAALALSILTVVSAKSYDITLTRPAKAGSAQLKPGTYKLTVEGGNATFTDKKQKSATTPVQVKESDKKFEDTRLITSSDGDVEKITEIDLGGSKTVLGF